MIIEFLRKNLDDTKNTLYKKCLNNMENLFRLRFFKSFVILLFIYYQNIIVYHLKLRLPNPVSLFLFQPFQ